MRYPALTKRLKAVFDQTRRGKTCADVGTDHGRLAAALAATGRSAFVFALDVNEKPLEKAKELFRRLRLEDITRALLSDGLDALAPPYPDDVIIAGLGADIAAEIIGRAPWLRDEGKRLILAPSSRDAAMRRYLCESGFEITNETPVLERGQVYCVMTARYTGTARELSDCESAAGLIRADMPDGAEYLKRKLKNAKRVIEETSKTPDNVPDALRLARERARYIELLLEEQNDGA